MIKLLDILNEAINGGIVYTYRSQKSLPDIEANGIKMSDKNKQNSEDYNIPDYGYTYYTSTSKDSNWIDRNPYGNADNNTASQYYASKANSYKRSSASPIRVVNGCNCP